MAFKSSNDFDPLIIEFLYLPSYGSELRKRYTLILLLTFLEEEGVLEVVLPGRGQMTNLGERFA